MRRDKRRVYVCMYALSPRLGDAYTLIVADATFLRCTTTIMAAACVSAALSGLKGRRWCSQDEVDVLTKLQEMTCIEAVCFF